MSAQKVHGKSTDIMASSKLLSEAKKALPANAADVTHKFLEAFYKNIPQEDRDMMVPSVLADTAQNHLRMSRDRKPGEPKIEIYTPPLEDEELGTGRTIVDIVNDDMPFLVDSVTAEITHNYKLIHILVHPMLFVKRSKSGNFQDIESKSGDDTVTQSHIHIELQGTLPEPTARALEEKLYKVLSDVYYATRDWQDMRKKLLQCQEDIRRMPGPKGAHEEREEYLEFLEYLYRDNFTLLGYREYKFGTKEGKLVSKTVKGASLGLLHDDIKPVFINQDDGALPENLQEYRRNQPPLAVSKVNKRSTVHRAVPLDAVAVKQYDEDGNAIGEKLFIGLFTSVTYSRSIQDIPLLSWKTQNVMERSGYKEGSHDYKALRHVLEKYPRDELFQIDEKRLLKICISILRLQERQRIALYTRPDPFGRYVSCLVYVPRDRYDTRLRLRIQDILEEEFCGETGDFYTNLDDSPLARVMFIIYINPKDPPKYSVRKIEQKLQQAGRLWREKLSDALLKEMPEESEAVAFVQRYGEAFPISYREEYEPKQAIFDIEKIEAALHDSCMTVDLYKCKECHTREVRLKVFHPGPPIPLSDVLPVLENMGMRVTAEMPFEVVPGGDHKETVWIHDFIMETADDLTDARIDEIKDRFQQALLKTWYGKVENDALNHLVLGARMSWREIKILRAYVRYMRQIGYHFGTRYIEQALTKNPQIAGMLVARFIAMHDPDATGDRDKAESTLAANITQSLEKVESLDEDRILRSINALIDATLRTNYFQLDTDGEPKTWLSLKINSACVKDMPKPVPYREIFVYSPRVEGIHLRGDVIARGGIRWSDRHEDFRTEVLGLMKAQQVKNAVIVPMGAKGGFVVKNPPVDGGRGAMLDEGIACYKDFIRGLLDITDNRKGKKVVHPQNVVCRDGEDPYLVVAADKGTASFSDIANGLAIEYGFWLGDAFASGGSAGYDHKEMGITARGAWESVKRHFRELNHDIQSKPFDVVGIGDMGGDVFGNGMLLSKHIRLIGAFNHLHIFCDPDPNPETSVKERKRLFKAVKGWGDYDKRKLSPGGQIYDRREKSLKLTPEIKARFDIEEDEVPPNELMTAMLKARTDLLWFGGIGTYVKATAETNADVGDKSNDSLRITAPQLRAKVIGEGANLAVTQKARIEYAQQGGRINADFIDNSGGVDSSDHEVNIKILTAEIMNGDKHKMTTDKRNKLLEEMTEEIAALVLRNNYQQAQAISLMEMQAADDLQTHARFIDDLTRKHGVSRKVENLPDEEEIQKRLSMGKGLSRPELALIQAYAKILFSKDLLNTDIPDMPLLEDYWLIDYFPHPVRKKYRSEILRHRLHREIIATTMANSLVNRMGPTFVKSVMDKTGVSCAEVARAYLVVRDTFGIREFWDKIEALDNKVPAAVQLKAMKAMSQMIERETLWFLTRLGRKPDMEKDITAFGKGIGELYKHIDSVVPHDLAISISQRTDSLVNDGLPKALAKQVALIPPMSSAFDIIRISLDCKKPLPVTAKVFFQLGEYFHIDWLRRQAKFMPTDDRWSREALSSLIDELESCQAGLTSHVIRQLGKDIEKAGDKDGNIIDYWINHYAPQARHLEPLFNDIRKSAGVDLPMLIIAEQRLRGLYGG